MAPSATGRPARSTADPVGPLLELAREVAAVHADGRLVGATVAVPGLVRGDDRSIAWTPNLGLEGPGLADRVGDALGGRCPVRVSNDANCAAYAESRHGAAVGVGHALYLTGTVGIGAGIIADGRLLRGREGFAGEVGHMPVGDSDGPVRLRQPRLLGGARSACTRCSPWSGCPSWRRPVRSAEAVAEAAAHDPQVRAGLEQLGDALGTGLALLANVLDPEVVVLGGYFVPLGDHVTIPAARTLDERLPSRVQRRPELRLGAIGPEAAATGAAEQALEAVFAGEVTLAAADGQPAGGQPARRDDTSCWALPMAPAGSSSRWPSAISAAPCSTESPAEPGHGQGQRLQRPGQGQLGQRRLDLAAHEREQGAQVAAEHDHPRVERVDDPGQAAAQLAADVEQLVGRARVALEDLAQRGDLVDRAADRGGDRERPDLGLPAAAVAAVALPTARVERDVPDLAAVAGRAGQLVAADDHAGTDADAARDVDEVVDPDAHAAVVLGERAEVGVVGDRDGRAQAELGLHDRGEVDVVPVHVGRQPHQPVATPDQAGHAHADARPGEPTSVHSRTTSRVSAATSEATRTGTSSADSRAELRWWMTPPRPTRATTRRSTPEVDGDDVGAVVG